MARATWAEIKAQKPAATTPDERGTTRAATPRLGSRLMSASGCELVANRED